VGKSIGDAQSALSNAGLKMGSISYEYSSTYAEGEVIWQQYDANAQLDKGSSVRVRVSKGAKPEQTSPTNSGGSGGEEDSD
ncbi:MAG: PASTA domain-containing protein, partial [Anaerovoracaceae bacterium]